MIEQFPAALLNVAAFAIVDVVFKSTAKEHGYKKAVSLGNRELAWEYVPEFFKSAGGKDFLKDILHGRLYEIILHLYFFAMAWTGGFWLAYVLLIFGGLEAVLYWTFAGFLHAERAHWSDYHRIRLFEYPPSLPWLRWMGPVPHPFFYFYHEDRHVLFFAIVVTIFVGAFL